MSKKRGAKPKGLPLFGRGKEQTQFLEALKLYEGKSYKKSIKILDGVLKKDSHFVDALALKGLDLLSTGEKTEASSLIKNALSKIEGTTASPICCHVLGIYMRTSKNYAESAKWFHASLNNGSNNMQIYRDLASLESQIGDFKGALVSRKKYWESFPGYRSNWTSLAIAQDMNGEHQQAVNTLTQFEKLVEGKIGDSELYEHNECLLYKNDILYRAAGDNKGKLVNAMSNLKAIEPSVYDKYDLLELKASIHMKMGELKEASKVYRMLIKRNPDNFTYYRLLEISLGIHGDNNLRKTLYEKLQKFYPRSEPPKFMPLTFTENVDELETKLEEYVRPQLARGVPATFCNVKPLYRNRRSIVAPLLEKIVSNYFKELNPTNDPLPYIWTCYYLAQHYLFMKDFQKSQDFIDKAIKHTPTLVELYIFKGRVLKHLGLLDEAAETLERGRKLDLQDRFINTKTVKYYLRAKNIEKAVEIASLFTKNDESVNGVKDLHQVEAAWFIIEQAEAYYKLYRDSERKLKEYLNEMSTKKSAEKEENNKNGTDETGDNFIRVLKNYEWQVNKYCGLSLKRFYAISKIYQQFEDDQMDFHSYCMRKGTPRAYVDMLKWGKTIYTQPIYVRAMKGAFKIYNKLYNDSKNLNENEQIENLVEKVMQEHSKKSKKENSVLNKRKEEEKKTVIAYPESDDKDPYGIDLVKSNSPMDAFMEQFYENYNRQAKEQERDYEFEFDYQYSNGKLALCLSALSKYTKYGHNSGLIGAMTIVLLLATKEDTKFDTIAKKVALKGCESIIEKFPVHERDNSDFDWLDFFQKNFDYHNLHALLFLHQYKVVESSRTKELILNELANKEPLIQNTVLQYEI